MSSHRKFDCFGFGLVTIDRLLLLEKYPAANEKTTALDARVCGGGPVANAIHALAVLGAKTALGGVIGNDPEGEIIRREFASGAIDAGALVIDPKGKTPEAQIWVEAETGNRTVVLYDKRISAPTLNDIIIERIEKSDYILLDGRDSPACLEIARRARETGAEVLLDLGSVREDTEALLKAADYVIVSKNFADAFIPGVEYEIALDKILDYGAKCSIITLGEKGWLWKDEFGRGRGEAFKAEVIDITGAGDVFHGAFIYGLIKGWNTKASARFAGAAAALTCRVLGGRGGFGAEKEVLDFMNRKP